MCTQALLQYPFPDRRRLRAPSSGSKVQILAAAPSTNSRSLGGIRPAATRVPFRFGRMSGRRRELRGRVRPARQCRVWQARRAAAGRAEQLRRPAAAAAAQCVGAGNSVARWSHIARLSVPRGARPLQAKGVPDASEEGVTASRARQERPRHRRQPVSFKRPPRRQPGPWLWCVRRARPCATSAE